MSIEVETSDVDVYCHQGNNTMPGTFDWHSALLELRDDPLSRNKAA